MAQIRVAMQADASPTEAAPLKPSMMVTVAPTPATWTLDQGFRPDTPPAEAPVPAESSALSGGKMLPVAPVSESDDPVVAVLGVGYVGSHLVDAFSRHYPVIGFDVSEKRICELREAELVRDGPSRSVRYENDPSELTGATHFLVAVPTLLRPDRTIDSSFLRSALKTVGMLARTGSTVVIESSVAVGMTRELLGPLAAERGFHAGMSPERVDPGRTDPPMSAIPKIISGLDDGSLEAVRRLYGPVFDVIVPVSCPEVAEMTKLYENCQRMVGIAYANEMADACIPLGIDPFEVCAAAATKPFGYLPFAPGLGVGGHCIPVNPFYVLSNCAFPLLQQAAATTWERPRRIAQRALAKLKARELGGATPRVLVVGLGFKPGQSNLSHSPGVELVKALVVSREVDVVWADALVAQDAFAQVKRLRDDEWTAEHLGAFDLVIVSFRQVGMDFGVLDDLENTEIEMWCK